MAECIGNRCAFYGTEHPNCHMTTPNKDTPELNDALWKYELSSMRGPARKELVSYIKTNYRPISEIKEAIKKIEAVNDSNGRYNACIELKHKLRLEE